MVPAAGVLGRRFQKTKAEKNPALPFSRLVPSPSTQKGRGKTKVRLSKDREGGSRCSGWTHFIF